jgi:hypothetical protein
VPSKTERSTQGFDVPPREHETADADVDRQKQEGKEPQEAGERDAVGDAGQVVRPGVGGSIDERPASGARQALQEGHVVARGAILRRVWQIEARLARGGSVRPSRLHRNEV